MAVAFSHAVCVHQAFLQQKKPKKTNKQITRMEEKSKNQQYFPVLLHKMVQMLAMQRTKQTISMAPIDLV